MELIPLSAEWGQQEVSSDAQGGMLLGWCYQLLGQDLRRLSLGQHASP